VININNKISIKKDQTCLENKGSIFVESEFEKESKEKLQHILK